MAINTNLIVVLYPLLLHKNNWTYPVTTIYILHEENYDKCKHVFAWDIRWPSLDLVTPISISSARTRAYYSWLTSLDSSPQILLRQMKLCFVKSSRKSKLCSHLISGAFTNWIKLQSRSPNSPKLVVPLE